MQEEHRVVGLIEKVIEKWSERENTQKKSIKRRMLSVREAADYMSIAEKTLRNRLGPKARNPFPVKPKHIGGRVLFDRKELDKYLDSLPTT